MSGPYPCRQCGGHGYIIIDLPNDEEKAEECKRCKGSGYMFLKTAGPGYPKVGPDGDHYEPAPKGNW